MNQSDRHDTWADQGTEPGESERADGLAIFADEQQVPAEPAAFVGLQLVGIVLTYAVLLGIAVIVGVVVVLVVTLVWPMLVDMSATAGPL